MLQNPESPNPHLPNPWLGLMGRVVGAWGRLLGCKLLTSMACGFGRGGLQVTYAYGACGCRVWAASG